MNNIYLLISVPTTIAVGQPVNCKIAFKLSTHTHISVLVVTVGCQENLGDFIHSAEQKR